MELGKGEPAAAGEGKRCMGLGKGKGRGLGTQTLRLFLKKKLTKMKTPYIRETRNIFKSSINRGQFTAKTKMKKILHGQKR